MAWLQFSVTVPKNFVDEISSFFETQGAVSVTYTDSQQKDILEPKVGETPLWQEVIITGLFADSIEVKNIWQELLSLVPGQSLASIKLEKLEDKNWTRAWMDNFKPMQFGKNLWIVPEGFSSPDPDGINIKLDPGLAFGTGTHPTTALCLVWLDANSPKDKIVIDYGCGSGVLALAAAMLGAKRVIALDNDPQALIATSENAKKNHIENIEIVSEPGLIARPGADLILANILAEPLLKLAAKFSKLSKHKARVVLSGILSKQMNDIKQRYRQYFDFVDSRIKDDWVCMEFKIK